MFKNAQSTLWDMGFYTQLSAFVQKLLLEIIIKQPFCFHQNISSVEIGGIMSRVGNEYFHGVNNQAGGLSCTELSRPMR